ncbi:hypothetical protein C8F04DRAFT_886840, partial [Mycena alexandri]
FRDVVGVPDKYWPDLTVQRYSDITGEAYLNPVFESPATVTHPENHKLFLEVIKQINSQFHKQVLPAGLTHKRLEFTWEHDLLYEMAKTSFRSCKVQWRKNTSEAVATRESGYQAKNRMRERRRTKLAQLEKAVEVYAKKYNIPAKVVRKMLLHEQYMSDEASGPEGDDETEKAVWKTRMAFKAGYDANDDVLNTKSFLEVLGCDWRSTEMSDALHEMATIAFDALGPRQKKAFQYIRVCNTGRSGTRVPDRAPYNFGMNRTW